MSGNQFSFVPFPPQFAAFFVPGPQRPALGKRPPRYPGAAILRCMVRAPYCNRMGMMTYLKLVAFPITPGDISSTNSR